MNKECAKLKKEIEELVNQQKVWDAISTSWDSFRRKPFPEIVEKCSLSWKPGKILDIGCGNCRNLIPFSQKGFECYGIDFSKGMLKEAEKFCAKNNCKAVLKYARAEKLPFSNSSFDYCMCVASLHHVDDYKKREKALNEIFRVLKTNGKALITCWNKVQIRFLLKPRNHYITWTTKGKTYFRYYYLFNYWELKKLIESRGFHVLYSSGPFDKNLTFIIQKPYH